MGVPPPAGVEGMFGVTLRLQLQHKLSLTTPLCPEGGSLNIKLPPLRPMISYRGMQGYSVRELPHLHLHPLELAAVLNQGGEKRGSTHQLPNPSEIFSVLKNQTTVHLKPLLVTLISVQLTSINLLAGKCPLFLPL